MYGSSARGSKSEAGPVIRRAQLIRLQPRPRPAARHGRDYRCVPAGRPDTYMEQQASKQKDRTDRAYICGSGLVYLWPFRVPTARSSLIAAACIASRPNSRARGIRGGRRGAGAGAGSHGDSELTGVPAPPRARELPIRQERESESEPRSRERRAPPRRGNTNSIAARNVFFFFVIKEL